MARLYSILRKELPRFRGNQILLTNIVNDYAKQCGVKLTAEQVKFLIKKFA